MSIKQSRDYSRSKYSIHFFKKKCCLLWCYLESLIIPQHCQTNLWPCMQGPCFLRSAIISSSLPYAAKDQNGIVVVHIMFLLTEIVLTGHSWSNAIHSMCCHWLIKHQCLLGKWQQIMTIYYSSSNPSKNHHSVQSEQIYAHFLSTNDILDKCICFTRTAYVSFLSVEKGFSIIYTMLWRNEIDTFVIYTWLNWTENWFWQHYCSLGEGQIHTTILTRRQIT